MVKLNVILERKRMLDFHSKRIITNILNRFMERIYHHHHHHHVVPPARISLTLSRHSSLSFITSGRSSGLHPVSSQSCCMYVRAGPPVFARPYEGVHKRTSLMSLTMILQRCPACLVRLALIVFVTGGRWPYSWCFGDVASRTCSKFLAAFLCSCRQAFSPSF